MALEKDLSEEGFPNRKAFLRDKERLLDKYDGQFVAYANGTFLDHAEGYGELTEKINCP